MEFFCSYKAALTRNEHREGECGQGINKKKRRGFKAVDEKARIGFKVQLCGVRG